MIEENNGADRGLQGLRVNLPLFQKVSLVKKKYIKLNYPPLFMPCKGVGLHVNRVNNANTQDNLLILQHLFCLQGFALFTPAHSCKQCLLAQFDRVMAKMLFV